MAISASTWVRIDGIGLDQAITDTSTTQVYPTGFEIVCKDVSSNARGVGKFMYAKGVASVVAGDLCVISPGGGAAIRTGARSIGILGVAMGAIVASNWGWFQVSGRGIVTAATVVADTQAYLCATAGAVDDAVVTGDLIYGMKIAGATDTGQCLVDMSRPYAGDTDNA